MNIKGNASHQFNSYQINLSCDNRIVYLHASSPTSRDNSNVVDNNISSTYNDETLIRRPARALDSSKNENSRGIEPVPTPSPKCALWYQNHNRKQTCLLNRTFLKRPVPPVACFLHLVSVHLPAIHLLEMHLSDSVPDLQYLVLN
ncbi:hypothetical protein NPIL_677811 [Nephila pilipes]|uniref:Uncharacterized protein n=1 Tax=Nephila pilipes TaxID=299642 RepID=A0A8X6U1K4_NEPPI|nr:hypothetical protein NPIL_677811 [Nephila pilipes]